MVSRQVDLTSDFNTNNVSKVQIDISGWDYVLAHIIGPSATISFNATNDGHESTGGYLGDASSAQNWASVQGTNQSTGTATTSSNSNNAIYKFSSVGKFLQLTAAAGTTVTKLLVQFAKIQ